ncbi:MAG: PAS domain S-box protein [Rubrivivax sp.]
MIKDFGNRLVALSLAALVAVALLIALNAHSAAKLREDIVDVDATRDLLALVQRVHASSLRMELAQHDQTTTPGLDAEQAFERAHAQLKTDLDRLIETPAAGAVPWAEDLAAMRQQVQGLSPAGRRDAVKELPPSAETLWRPLRQLVSTLDTELTATFTRRRAERAASLQRQVYYSTGLGLALALMAPAVYALTRRDRARQQRQQQDQTQYREGLERHVAERTSELQEATRQLALSADRLQRIFDSASEGILTTDSDQVILQANPACARMFGCAVSDLVGLPLERLIPPRLRDAHRQSVQAFGDSGVHSRPMARGTGREVMAIRWNGEEFPIEASISRSEVQGQRLYTVIHRDLTEERRAARALERTQAMLVTTFRDSNLAMAQVEPGSYRFRAANPALCRMSGYSETELLQMTLLDLSHPDEARDPGLTALAVPSSNPHRIERQLVRKDGTAVWIEVAASLVATPESHSTRLVAFLQDVTARHAAEAALRERESRLSLLVRLNDRVGNLHDPGLIAFEASCLLGEHVGADRVGFAEDAGDGEHVTVARNCARGVRGIEGRYRYADYGQGQLTDLQAGRTVVRTDIARDLTLSEAEKQAHAALQVGASVNVPLLRDGRLHAVFFVHAATARHWTEAELRLFEDVALRIRADIDRAGAQAQLQAAKSKFETALASMSDAVVITDTEGRPMEFNDVFVEFHRFRALEECVRVLSEFPELLEIEFTDGTPAPLDQWPISRALRGETASSVEYRLKRRDTGESWVASYSFAPIRDRDGTITGSVVTGRDVTRLKSTQEALAQSHATLRHLLSNQRQVQEDERKRIARELHDDLQQSLAAIRIDLATLTERVSTDTEDLRALLSHVDVLAEQAIASTRRIVSDLRPAILEELGLLAALEALCKEHTRLWSARCVLELSGGDLSTLVDAPSLSIGLYRIVQECLNNVAKHARASEVKVSLDTLRNGRVVLRVSDNGVGMAQTGPRKPGSFGLLGIAERVRALGGTMNVASEAGRGTVLEVMVPALGPGLIGDSGGREGEPWDGWSSPEPGRGGPRFWGQPDQPLQAAIDALDGAAALLDSHGIVRLVNAQWQRDAPNGKGQGLAGVPVGSPYLPVCRRLARRHPSLVTLLRGLETVMLHSESSVGVVFSTNDPAGRCTAHLEAIGEGMTLVSLQGNCAASGTFTLDATPARQAPYEGGLPGPTSPADRAER